MQLVHTLPETRPLRSLLALVGAMVVLVAALFAATHVKPGLERFFAGVNAEVTSLFVGIAR